MLAISSKHLPSKNFMNKEKAKCVLSALCFLNEGNSVVNRDSQLQNTILKIMKNKKVKLKLDKMNCNEKIEGEELFDFNKKSGWNFILNNAVINDPNEKTPMRQNITELITDLNNDKEIEKLIMNECKVGDVYKERVKVEQKR